MAPAEAPAVGEEPDADGAALRDQPDVAGEERGIGEGLDIDGASRVRVHESLVELQTVTDASPDGRVHDDLLERDVTHLAPGRDQQLAMKWLPYDEGAQVHRAAVTMHAAVGVTTNIVAPEPMKNPPPRRELDPRVEQGSFEFERPRSKPPVEPEPVPEVEPARHSAISCEVKHVERITVDELVELQIFVRNMGNTPLHDVRIVASVPRGLKHRRGEWRHQRVLVRPAAMPGVD